MGSGRVPLDLLSAWEEGASALVNPAQRQRILVGPHVHQELICVKHLETGGDSCCEDTRAPDVSFDVGTRKVAECELAFLEWK